MAARRAIAALLLCAAVTHATAARQLLQNCVDQKYAPTTNAKTKKFLDANYGERAVANYADTCAAAANKQCLAAKDDGCSLWTLGQKHCTGDQAAFGAKHGFIYSGSSQKGPGGHVIGIPCAPVRGVEDIPTNQHKAVAATKAMWPTMWADMTTNSIRGTSGYPATTGALVINTPSNREYHQLHIHAGERTPQFDKCVASMSYKANGQWQLMTCDGLQEGGKTSAQKISAQLLYKTVKSLDDVWGAYTSGLKLKHGGLAIGGAATSKYHVGVLVTSPPSKLHNGQWFVALYAPPTLSAPKLGRGSFLIGV